MHRFVFKKENLKGDYRVAKHRVTKRKWEGRKV